MKSPSLPSVVFAALTLSCTPAVAQSPGQQERIEAAYLLALGRRPSPGEMRAGGQAEASVADRIARCREQLTRDDRESRATVVRSCRDAFGRAPREDELTVWAGAKRTYAGLMRRHLQWLAEHPDAYREVIERAYRLVLQRAAHSIEFDYWRARDVLPFALLVASIENWAQRNAPGLMSTTGTPCISVNSAYLHAVRLSPAIADEARAANGPESRRDPRDAALGRNLVAPGAQEIVSVGGIHFVAVGRDDLVPAMAANR